MKATLEFNLPEEKETWKITNDAVDWYTIVIDLDNYLRGKIKNEDRKWAEPETIYQEVRDTLYELLADREMFI